MSFPTACVSSQDYNGNCNKGFIKINIIIDASLKNTKQEKTNQNKQKNKTKAKTEKKLTCLAK